MLLRNDVRLLMRVSSTVRAVCLGPATVVDMKLAGACQGFVASIVNGGHEIQSILIVGPGLHACVFMPWICISFELKL